MEGRQSRREGREGEWQVPVSLRTSEVNHSLTVLTTWVPQLDNPFCGTKRGRVCWSLWLVPH